MAKQKILIVDDEVDIASLVVEILTDEGYDAKAVHTGEEGLAQIKQFNPEIHIVIYTMHSDKEFVIDLFRAGISAYVLKDDPLSDLILALKAVKAGGTYFSTMAPTVLLRHMEELEEKTTSEDSLDRLSQREQEVFGLINNSSAISLIPFPSARS